MSSNSRRNRRNTQRANATDVPTLPDGDDVSNKENASFTEVNETRYTLAGATKNELAAHLLVISGFQKCFFFV